MYPSVESIDPEHRQASELNCGIAGEPECREGRWYATGQDKVRGRDWEAETGLAMGDLSLEVSV